MIEFTGLNYAHNVDDIVGHLPEFLNEDDNSPACKQLDRNYVGGWHNFNDLNRRHGRFQLHVPTMKLTYPGDPPMLPLAHAKFRNEDIYVYLHAWVLILQKDQSFEISRMD